MNQEIKNKIVETFKENDQNCAIDALGSMTLKDVMGESQSNLDNTSLSIVYLAKGSLGKLKELVAVAKVDFRDVIYWATLEKEKEENK